MQCSGHQLHVFEFSSILTLSSWKEYQTLWVEDSTYKTANSPSSPVLLTHYRSEVSTNPSLCLINLLERLTEPRKCTYWITGLLHKDIIQEQLNRRDAKVCYGGKSTELPRPLQVGHSPWSQCVRELGSSLNSLLLSFHGFHYTDMIKSLAIGDWTQSFWEVWGVTLKVLTLQSHGWVSWQPGPPPLGTGQKWPLT